MPENSGNFKLKLCRPDFKNSGPLFQRMTESLFAKVGKMMFYLDYLDISW